MKYIMCMHKCFIHYKTKTYQFFLDNPFKVLRERDTEIDLFNFRFWKNIL